MKLSLAVFAIAVIAVVGFSVMQPGEPATGQISLKTFSSYDELKDFVKANYETQGFGYYSIEESVAVPLSAADRASSATSPAPEAASEYSTTNVQVEGVDEADIVKNDGKYIYAVSGKKVVIIDAYPAEDAEILSEIEEDSRVQEIFVNSDKLVVFSPVAEDTEFRIAPYYPNEKTSVKIYDISDRENPLLDREETLDGYYFSSRMIGDYVYFITTRGVYFVEGEVAVPLYDPEKPETFPAIRYFDVPDNSYTFTSIASVNTQDISEEMKSEIFMMVSAQNIYASTDNIYVTHERRVPINIFAEKMIDDVLLPVLPADVKSQISEIRSSDMDESRKFAEIYNILEKYSETLDDEERRALEQQTQERREKFYEEIAKETEKTIIHKISVKDGDIEYQGQGEVPGHVLNQFSMDEHNNNLRIATTTGQVSRGGATSANHVYVLDSDLNIIGKVEDLAPGEQIYSARFIGDRAYMVTFRKVDPLFVIDMSDPTNPEILGKLKIPGYSDYLHPFDEDHIIGVGKEAVAAEQGDFAWYQGVKISLFDVSDVENPKEVSKVEIGDRGTDSYALYDHKAFLFSRDKNLLVVPILLAEIDEDKYPSGVPDNAYGEFVWQGAYVYDLTLDNGFDLKGMITHVDDDSLEKSGYFYYSSSSIKRSLYIGDTLYTVSDKKVAANDLSTLGAISEVELPYEDNGYPFIEVDFGPVAVRTI